MTASYLAIIGDLHNINSCVDINIRQQQFPRLCRLQIAHWTLAVVSQPGEWVHAVATILPLHLHHPLLIQSPCLSHQITCQREGS